MINREENYIYRETYQPMSKKVGKLFGLIENIIHR